MPAPGDPISGEPGSDGIQAIPRGRARTDIVYGLGRSLVREPTPMLSPGDPFAGELGSDFDGLGRSFAGEPTPKLASGDPFAGEPGSDKFQGEQVSIVSAVRSFAG